MVKNNMFGTGYRLQFAIWLACGMAFILFGYDQGVFSGIVGNEDFPNQMGKWFLKSRPRPLVELGRAHPKPGSNESKDIPTTH